MKQVVCSIVLAVSLSACVKLASNKSEQDTAPEQNPVQNQAPADPESIVKELDNKPPSAGEAKLYVGANPNDFRIMIGWSGQSNQIRRFDVNLPSDPGIIIERKPGDTEPVFYDKDIRPKHSYIYQFLSNDPTAKVLLQTAQISAPFDVLLRTDVSQNILFDWTEVPFRIFVPDNFRGYTNGGEVELKAKYIFFSEGSKIETYSEGAAAEEGAVGRSGGKLTISAEKIMGSPVINMRGMVGGKGFNGPEINPAQSGPAGPPAVEHCELEEIGGGPGRGGMMSISPLGRKHCFCEKAAENGKPGFDGINGHRGQDGLSGGDSGYLLIKGKDLRDFKPTISISFGAGGVGGMGGGGQQGGAGGAGGRGVHNCSAGEPGPAGKSGQPGGAGQKGRDGVLIPWCTESEGVLKCEG